MAESMKEFRKLVLDWYKANPSGLDRHGYEDIEAGLSAHLPDGATGQHRAVFGQVKGYLNSKRFTKPAKKRPVGKSGGTECQIAVAPGAYRAVERAIDAAIRVAHTSCADVEQSVLRNVVELLVRARNETVVSGAAVASR